MTDALMAVYNRPPLLIEQGEGCWVHAADGRTYLDCVAGIATNALGHCHPALVSALSSQAAKLWHTSNIFRVADQERLADRLTELCFADVVFFANSGTEAIECALKTARRYHHANGEPHRIDIVGFDGAFHGRTYAAVNAAGNPTYLEGFGPALPGYRQIPFGDHAALEAAVSTPTTAAIIVEPVQGEGGARAIPESCLRSLRTLCDTHGVLLIHDEVQSGMGRTGRLFAHQWAQGAEPDIMAVAKALGGGFPIGACLASRKAAVGMTVGAHGSTFGGNPLAMAVCLATLAEIAKPDLLANVRTVSDQLFRGLRAIAARHPHVIADVRGKGLLIGVQTVPNNREVMARARDHGLLVAGGGQNCVRLLPPLTLRADEADEALRRFEACCASYESPETETR